MVAPSTATNASSSDRSDYKGEKFVALCTGATGISSIHLVRHLLKDARFGKVYGVSRRDLYDLPVAHVEHVKLDLLDPQKVKDELKSKGIKDGTLEERKHASDVYPHWCLGADNCIRAAHAEKPLFIDSWCLACSDASIPGKYWYHHNHQVLHTQSMQIVRTL